MKSTYATSSWTSDELEMVDGSSSLEPELELYVYLAS